MGCEVWGVDPMGLGVMGVAGGGHGGSWSGRRAVGAVPCGAKMQHGHRSGAQLPSSSRCRPGRGGSSRGRAGRQHVCRQPARATGPSFWGTGPERARTGCAAGRSWRPPHARAPSLRRHRAPLGSGTGPPVDLRQWRCRAGVCRSRCRAANEACRRGCCRGAVRGRVPRQRPDGMGLAAAGSCGPPGSHRPAATAGAAGGMGLGGASAHDGILSTRTRTSVLPGEWGRAVSAHPRHVPASSPTGCAYRLPSSGRWKTQRPQWPSGA